MHPDDALNFHIPPDLVRGPFSDGLSPLSGPSNWGMKVFDVDRLRSKYDGSGIIVGVIDTGCDETHPDLRGQVIAARDFTGSPIGSRDRNGHGTHCAGTVAASNPEIGVATGAKLVIGKALSDSGSGAGTWIAAAMRWAVAEGATILSMSLGSSGADPTIREACVELEANGVWIVAAAGNSGGNTPDVDFPGRFAETLSIAALNQSLAVASFSNRGAKIDGAAAGVDIVSCRPGGGFQSMSGTSMATPMAAGILACYRQGRARLGLPPLPVAALRAKLVNMARDVHTPGVDNRTGPGAVWPLQLANDLEADFPAVAP
jgi:subtilisin family serine protease